MTELIQQIKLFRGLKLIPVSVKEIKRWECEIEKHLIKINNIKECYVRMYQKETKPSSIKKQSCGRVLRQRKKKICCKMCYCN